MIQTLQSTKKTNFVKLTVNQNPKSFYKEAVYTFRVRNDTIRSIDFPILKEQSTFISF